MPIYVYGCPRCDVLIEELRPMELADFPPVECPACHGLCEREMATFSIGGRAVEGAEPSVPLLGGGNNHAGQAAPPEPIDPFDRTAPLTHGPNCPCCFGRRSA